MFMNRDQVFNQGGNTKNYLPELAAENTKIKMQAFKMPGKALIPLNLIATTNGLAVAEVLFLFAAMRSGELYGTNIPRRRTRTT